MGFGMLLPTSSGIQRAFTHPEYRSSGAFQLLIWKILQVEKDTAKTFHFGGSVMEKIAPVNQAFGAQPYPYFLIIKGRNRWIEALYTLLARRP